MIINTYVFLYIYFFVFSYLCFLNLFFSLEDGTAPALALQDEASAEVQQEQEAIKTNAYNYILKNQYK